MVFGGTSEERVQINEIVRSGAVSRTITSTPTPVHISRTSGADLRRQLADAAALAERAMGRPKLPTPYQPFCDLRMHFPATAQPEAYHRELRLDEAVATTTYVVDGVEFRREVFASYQDQVLVVRLTTSQPKRLTFDVAIDSPQEGTHVETTEATDCS